VWAIKKYYEKADPKLQRRFVGFRAFDTPAVVEEDVTNT
jgi:hypothetical protein